MKPIRLSGLLAYLAMALWLLHVAAAPAAAADTVIAASAGATG